MVRSLFCLTALAAAPAWGLRLLDGPSSGADPLALFSRIAMKNKEGVRVDAAKAIKSNANLTNWLRKVGAAEVSGEFLPRLFVSGGRWRMVIPTALDGTQEGARGGKDCVGFPSKPEQIYMQVSREGGLCFSSITHADEAASAMALFQEAVALLRKDGKTIGPFRRKTICVSDDCATNLYDALREESSLSPVGQQIAEIMQRLHKGELAAEAAVKSLADTLVSIGQ
eukprot:CAMPEP_0204523916 /NCGR_PEP_ID=MMETSP0661-20131031/7097_1 /ASSEMBLY_ACC=CAM_ASM_000606 /TAXON_ID=109239 /ORGANISM="Alexandrium margalefi, Strain AMGDE01CS-322" /LENGTH=225 /DNA_ID=CAMNT_0051529643 /DNA_START=95 /DNA_END=772 /DNA_ORIENTATION=+